MKPPLAEVWCSRCPKPANEIIYVASGSQRYKAAYCADCAWLLRAPRGNGRKDAKR